MSWKQDIQICDLDGEQLLEIICDKCHYACVLQVLFVRERIEHHRMYIDEIETNFKCIRSLCGHNGAKIMLIQQHNVEAFVGGLP